jgi:DNA polymerase-1
MRENNPKLLIVDGSNLLFQMFYGMPARIFNKEGKPIHGTIGFVGALLKIIRMTAPSHAVVLFDGECHNERKDLDESYKANRPDFSQMSEAEVPFSQLPDIFKALAYLKIPFAKR